MKCALAIILSLSIGCVVLSNAAAEQESLSVTDAWIRLAPPGSSVNAAYMHLHNPSSSARIISAVNADCCAEVMMHQSRQVGDKIFMEHLDSLEIPPQSELMLTPGGVHLMLFDAQAPLGLSDEVKITLVFSDNQKQILRVPVKRSADD
jgi:copper(I)-binding protein